MTEVVLAIVALFIFAFLGHVLVLRENSLKIQAKILVNSFWPQEKDGWEFVCELDNFVLALDVQKVFLGRFRFPEIHDYWRKIAITRVARKYNVPEKQVLRRFDVTIVAQDINPSFFARRKMGNS